MTPAEGPPDGPIDRFVAVVPAGGAGTRLWPLSRAGSPKFLHDLTGAGRTLLQSTWDRLAPLTGPGGVLVVTGRPHADAVRDQLPDLDEQNLLAEPSPRDSMAAIGLAAAVLVRRDPGLVLGSFAADHVVDDVSSFSAAVRQAVGVARQGYLVTVGIAPTGPATGFGYIRPGGTLAVEGARDARSVSEFVEKPDAGAAQRYVDAGYLWNAGMFVVRAQVLLDHLRTQLPALHDGLVEIAADLAGGGGRVGGSPSAVMERVWPGLTRIAIDHAIAEPVAAAGGVAVVPGSFGWDDVGDWHSLAGLLGAGPDGVCVLGDPSAVLGPGSSGLVVPASGRTVTVVGVADAVVVDTPDALLVTTRDRAQDVKAVVDELRVRGRTDLL